MYLFLVTPRNKKIENAVKRASISTDMQGRAIDKAIRMAMK